MEANWMISARSRGSNRDRHSALSVGLIVSNEIGLAVPWRWRWRGRFEPGVSGLRPRQWLGKDRSSSETHSSWLLQNTQMNMDGWMDGWMNGWEDGWRNGRVVRSYLAWVCGVAAVVMERDRQNIYMKKHTYDRAELSQRSTSLLQMLKNK